MHRGWIKLWRKSFDSGIHRNHKLWVMWTWILANVTRKELQYITGNQRIMLKPGQIVIGRKRLAEELAMSEQNIRTCLLLLKNFGNLTIKSTNKYSLLTVVNWELYQGDNQKVTSKSTSIQPATNQQLTTKQEVENLKKVKKYIPGDFLLNEKLKAYALDRNIDPRKIYDLFESFKDYHIEKGTKLIDWNRAWYTWVRNAPEYSKWAMKKNREGGSNSNWRDQCLTE